MVHGAQKFVKMLDFGKLGSFIDGPLEDYGYCSQDPGRVICALTVCE